MLRSNSPQLITLVVARVARVACVYRFKSGSFVSMSDVNVQLRYVSRKPAGEVV